MNGSSQPQTETATASRPVAAKPRLKPKRTEAPSRKAVSSKDCTKQDRVLQLLRQPKGTTIGAIEKATGWQQHSVRGFLAGVVRKKLKFRLTSEKIDGVRIYRIGAPRGSKATTKKSSRRSA